MKQNLKILLTFSRGHLFFFILALALTIFLGASRAFFPVLVEYIFDSVLQDVPHSLPNWLDGLLQNDDTLIHLRNSSIILAGLAVIRGLGMILAGVSRAGFSEGIARALRERVYHHINHLSYKYHKNADTGDLIQRSTTDIDMIRKFFYEDLFSFLWILSMSVVIIYTMFLTNVTMAWLSVFILPVTITLSAFFFTKLEKVFETVEKSESALTTTVQENLNGVRVVKAFNRERFEIEKFKEKNDIYFKRSYDMYKLEANYWSLSDSFTFLQIAVTLIAGTYFAVQGVITTGELLSFVLMVQTVVWPIRNLGRIVAEFSKTMVSVDRLAAILREEEEYKDNGHVTSGIEGRVEFQHVSFKFDDVEEHLLKDMSFTISKGETIAIMGKTGSGKSTFAKLLIRLLDYQQGQILIDGVALTEYDKKYLRSQIGVILQEPFLFSATLEKNIGITLTELSTDKIKRAADVASIAKDINTFSQGYETLVGERGVTLSGGQKQRVAIARTLVTPKPIMVFDDSLSALDTETDLAIRRALKDESKNTTVFIITHRITTAMEADRIMILEDGKIAQFGPHEELINQPGLYQTLYTIQTGLEAQTKQEVAHGLSA
jgi:ATP-binding cassette, subfamily B, bacterial